MADEQTTASAEPAPPVPSRLVSVAPGALDLFVRVAEIVHGPASEDAKLAFVVETARAAAGGERAAFVRLDPETLDLVPTAGSLRPGDLDEPTRIEIVRHTLRAGDVLVVEPVFRGASRADRPDVLTHVMAVPVPRREHSPHGALVVGLCGDDGFGSGALESVQALAAHLGVALDNLVQVQELQQLRAAQKEAVHQLSEAVRPPMPTAVPETELGVHYLQADPYAQTGGDLYDWQVLPDGDLLIVVVDVLGKGVVATKDAVNVIHAVRLLVLEGCPLERVVARADEVLVRQNPDLVATLLLARYTPSSGVLRLAGGGHPPMLLVKGDKAARYVAAPGIPIGWPGAGSHEVVTVTLEHRDVAIFYTDGLVEATKDIEQGFARLAEAAIDTMRYPAQPLARALVERALEGGTRSDDTLALVLRRRTPPSAEPVAPMGPFEYRFSPSLANVSLVRHFLADWLKLQRVEGTERDDLLLIASELCSNAVREGSGAPSSLALRAKAEGDAVVIEVEDDGTGFEWPASRPEDELPDPEAEAGRGLFLVTALADEVGADVDDGRTLVRAIKRAVLPSARPVD